MKNNKHFLRKDLQPPFEQTQNKLDQNTVDFEQTCTIQYRSPSFGHGLLHDAFTSYLSGALQMDPTKELIMVLDCRAGARVRGRVTDRVERSVCLGTDDAGCECEKPASRRGLCNNCYYRFRATMLAMSLQEQALYAARLIRSGRLLSPNEAKIYRSKSIFRKLA